MSLFLQAAWRPDDALVGILIVVGFASTSALLVRFLIRFSLKRKILDVPNDRSSHAVPTPRGGGIAIAVLTMSGVAIAWLSRFVGAQMLAWMAGAAAIAIVSWIDDLRGLSNQLRFLVHSTAAVLAIYAFGAWSAIDLGPFGILQLGAFGPLLTFLWIVGLTNAWNFMDGIDGIAGASAIVAAVFAVLLSGGSAGTLALAIPLAGATAGFLYYNRPPARIFMGDVGSAFLGYSLAVLLLMIDPGHPRSPWIALLSVWPFVFDASLTFIRRASRRENIFSAHRSHLYQRLVIAGRSHLQVSLLYVLLSIAGGLAAIALDRSKFTTVAIAVTMALALSLWVVTELACRHSESAAFGGHRGPAPQRHRE